MAATTGGAVITDDQLDEWLTERGASVEDIRVVGAVQREFIDFLDTQRGREIIPPDPTREEVVTGLPPAPVPIGAPPPPPAGFRIPLPSVGGLTSGVTGAIADALSGPFDAIGSVIERVTGTIRDLAEATIPTISELALGIASAVGDGLDFIADNMAEVGDFAGAMAAALITPLEELAEVVGERARDFILSIVGLIFRALGGLRAVLPAVTMERPI